MDSSLSSYGENLTGASETFSLAFLLQCGIGYTRQGSYVEGAAFFALAREQLSADQMQTAEMLDAFLQSHSNYWQAQQSLHEASKWFAEVDIEQQTRIQAIEKLLLDLSEETDQAMQSHLKPNPPQLSKNQLQQPRVPLRLLSSDQKDSKFAATGPTTSENLSKAGDILPDLYITCFGRFEVRRFDQPIVLCHSRCGQVVLRYLIAQEEYCASIDKLMDIMWPQDTPEKARHKLQVAVSALRHTLNGDYRCNKGDGYIICKDGLYRFNSTVTVRTDVDKFLSLWQAGRQASGSESAILFERACNMCNGPFLVEDTYADWSFTRREQLKQIYFTMCRTLAGYYLELRQYEDALKWASAVLREDRCDETAHRQLIRIYTSQGRRSEALQQYSRCERILSQELGVQPMPETTKLLQSILNSNGLPLPE